TPFGSAPFQPAYNIVPFRKAGIKTPGELAETGKWDTDALVDAAKWLTVTDASGKLVQFGLNLRYDLAALIHWFWAGGGDVLSPDRSKAVLNSAANVATAQFIQDLRWKHR